ncbi:MAG: FkbM family methyltransferase [Candidatus Hodarchaeota archaeon]
MKIPTWKIMGGQAMKLIQWIMHRPKKRKNLEKLGSKYGGWFVPVDILNENSICYCVGVGEDISFDMELIKRFSCHVFAFDPTPRAKKFVEENTLNIPNFNFYDIGLWSSNEKLKFYAPKDPTHVSHSILNLQKTNNFFIAQCKRLSQIMNDLDHSYIDILKLDIEGAEEAVLDSIITDKLDIKVICIEFHYPLKEITALVKKLTNWNYDLVNIDNWNYTFIRKES